MNCLDTDLLVGILRGSGDTRKIMERLDEEGVQFTTSINVFELFVGAFLSRKRDTNLRSVESLLAKLSIIELDAETAKLAGLVAARLKQRGVGIDFRDVLIAAIALSHDLTIITRNVRHFSRIEGLKVQVW